MHFKLENTWSSGGGGNVASNNTNNTNNYYIYPWHKTNRIPVNNDQSENYDDDELDDDEEDEDDEDEAEAEAIAVLEDCDDLSLLVDEYDNYSPQTHTSASAGQATALNQNDNSKKCIISRTSSSISFGNSNSGCSPIILTPNINSNNTIINKMGASNNKKGKDFRLKDEIVNPENIEKLKFENILYNHTDEKPWVCKNCGRNYKWKNSLKCHLRNECGVAPKYHCTKMCGYKTHIFSNLKRHLKSKFCRPMNSAIETDSQTINDGSLN